ncbi:ice-binding family protein [Streptomyces sp. 5112.2]|uniref:ice-binding family protein n=1 Tax=Streptomyces sp. 5112.2 TaxID=1938848 RepID=UPI0027D79927|nr:ice-binding family protein [Streptomyces sp. 5112.2]
MHLSNMPATENRRFCAIENRRIRLHPLTGVGPSMTLNIPVAPLRRTLSVWTAAVLAVVISAVVVAVTPTQASALATFVDLGRADSFAVLAGSATTNTGPSVITGDVGVSPGTSISGYGPPAVVNGTLHSADTVAQDAQTDLIAAYDDAAGQPSDGALPPDAGGLTLVPGVYTASSTLGLTGTLTLDAQGNPNAVWVFQIGSGLTTASGSRVSLINGASPCNVFWQIGSSATLGTSTAFVGNILAMTSITATTSATIEGRALARNGAVTLDTNTITRPECAAGTTGGTTTAGTTGTTTAGTTGATTAGTTGTTTTGTTTTGTTTTGTTGATTTAGTTGATTTGTTGATTTGTTGATTTGTTGATTTAGTTGATTTGTTGATTTRRHHHGHHRRHHHGHHRRHHHGHHRRHHHGHHRRHHHGHHRWNLRRERPWLQARPRRVRRRVRRRAWTGRQLRL